ncbi:MAG: hypothetical protein B6D34_08990 [Candidatus Brocadia sp. UTAMX1]|jgi:hypothetical protein|nr:MAG: hypothetical protein B6D34_08990 [Candidatus Brocadia sp. UTAMX1]
MPCDLLSAGLIPLPPAINYTSELLWQPTTGTKDLSIFDANIFLLNKFQKHFSSCFSNTQLAMFTLDIYALFKDCKKNSLDTYDTPKKAGRGISPAPPK